MFKLSDVSMVQDCLNAVTGRIMNVYDIYILSNNRLTCFVYRPKIRHSFLNLRTLKDNATKISQVIIYFGY